MNIVEKKLNLFDIGVEYYLAHCISSDFALGKDIIHKCSCYTYE